MKTPQAPHPGFPGAIWRKSSYSSGADAGDKHVCVEVAAVGEDERAVRDSKIPEGPVIRLSRGDWRSLIARLK
ncbi:DUF397 domain-containing protein [Actinomadura sp. NPDC023710]|uniref:DUF397 domain-containing protein n=1 Tax=Actinomadura sp. NPDC023710 TaxID=3158219 RepID=UPI0033C63DC8